MKAKLTTVGGMGLQQGIDLDKKSTYEDLLEKSDVLKFISENQKLAGFSGRISEETAAHKPDMDKIAKDAKKFGAQIPKINSSITRVNELARSPKQLGNAIRRARKRMGISQTQLGDMAGLRQETLSLLENGNPAAKLETILSVLNALDLELQIALRSKDGLNLVESWGI